MFSFLKKTAMPSPETALPGRPEPLPTAETHAVFGRKIVGGYPDGMEQAVFGMGCFWGAERKFWELGPDKVWITAVGYAAGYTPNPTYEEVCSGHTGHNEVLLVVYDPAVTPYEALLKVFWENHDPTQGMRQGNDVGTQYRSGIYVASAAQQAAAEASRERFQAALDARGFGGDYDRDQGNRPVLLCRGLSPAISAQGPARLLRAWRDRGELSGGRRGGVVRQTRSPPMARCNRCPIGRRLLHCRWSLLQTFCYRSVRPSCGRSSRMPLVAGATFRSQRAIEGGMGSRL